jgi:hypothetical protein
VLGGATDAELVSVGIELEVVKLVTHRIPHRPILRSPGPIPPSCFL